MKFSVFTASTPEWEPADRRAHPRCTGLGRHRVAGHRPGAGRAAGILGGQPRHLAAHRPGGLARRDRPDHPRRRVCEMSGIGGYAKAADHENVLRMLSATATLGAAPGAGDDALERRRRLPGGRSRGRATDLAWAVDRARELGVKVLVELHHRTITASASAALRLVDGLDPAHVGVIHDLGNLVIEGQEDALAGFQLLGDYLAHVHVKNVAWRPHRGRRLRRRRRMGRGLGDAPRRPGERRVVLRGARRARLRRVGHARGLLDRAAARGAHRRRPRLPARRRTRTCRSVVARDAPRRPVRMAHLGLGAFHRAHQAWYTAARAAANPWGIAAFTGRSPRCRRRPRRAGGCATR